MHCSLSYCLYVTAAINVISRDLAMNELIRQTKCLPICFPSQTTKLNVCQMYHSYGTYVVTLALS